MAAVNARARDSMPFTPRASCPRKDQPVPLGQHADRLAPAGLQRGSRIEARSGSAARERARASPARGAEPITMTRPPGRRRRSASRTAATRSSAPIPAEQSARVVDDDEIERGVVEGQPRRRRDFELEQHALLRGGLRGRARPTPRRARRRRRGPKGRPCRRWRPDVRPPAHPICAMRSPILHAGHADYRADTGRRDGGIVIGQPKPAVEFTVNEFIGDGRQ